MSAFNQIKDTYSTHIPIFTDGSKEDNKDKNTCSYISV